MIFNIALKQGVGPIRLGQACKEVRNALKSPAKEFMKSYDDTVTTDSFHELHIHVFYDQKDRCEAIELFKRADVFFENIHFFKMTPQEVLGWFRQMDPDLEVDAVEGISRKLGLAFYVHDGLDDPEGKVDSILVCGDDYWD